MTSIYSVVYPSSATGNSSGRASSPAVSTRSPISSSQLVSQSSSMSALSAYGNVSANDTKSWYEAMAKAWGQALDKQAQVITQMSDAVSNGGNDQPSQITQLTAESERFSFLSTNASTATTSVGQALDSLGRKQ